MKLIQTFTLLFFVNILFSQTLLWKNVLNGQKKEIIKDTHIDNNNNIYTTGYFTEDLNSQNQIIESNGLYDIFVQKLNSNGELLWLKKYGSMSLDEGVAITTDNNGNVFISGNFNISLELDSSTTLVSNGLRDIFLIKLNPDGELLWANTIGGPKFDSASSISVDSSGNIYCIGRFSETVDFDFSNNDFFMTSSGNIMFSSSADSFVAKYDGDGNFIWAKQYDDESASTSPSQIIVTDLDEVLIIGYFSGVVDFDPSSGVEFFFSNSSNTLDGYLLKLNSDGNFQSAFQLKAGLGGRINPRDIKLDSQGNVYIIGSFTEIVDFDPGVNESFKISDGVDDVFILKLNSVGEFVWVKQIKNNSEFIGFELALDQEGNIYSVGYFKGVSDFNPDQNSSFILFPNSNNDFSAYLLALKKDGSFIDAFEYGGADFWFYNGIAIDNNNDIIIAGVFENQVDINPSPDSTDLATAIDLEDSYIIKLQNPLSTTSVNVINDKEEFKIYPNPIDDKLNIESLSTNLTYSIYDLTGRKIKSGLIKNKTSSMDCIDLNSGIYFLEIYNKGTFKIIKR